MFSTIDLTELAETIDERIERALAELAELDIPHMSEKEIERRAAEIEAEMDDDAIRLEFEHAVRENRVTGPLADEIRREKGWHAFCGSEEMLRYDI